MATPRVCRILRTACCLLVLASSSLGAPAFASGEPTLDDLMSEAISTYPGMASVQTGARAAKSDVSAAKHAYGPNLAVSTQLNQVSYAANTQGAVGGRIPSALLSLSQGIWGGGVKAGLRRAKASLKAADFGILDSALDLRIRVLTSYANWKRFHDRIAVLEDAVALLDKWVGDISRREGQGLASLADVKLAQIRLQQAKGDLAGAQYNRTAAEQEVSGLVGRPLTTGQLAAIDATPPPLPDQCADIVDRAVELNPRLSQLRYESEAAAAAADQAVGQSLPQLAFQVQHSIGSATTPGWPSFTTYGLVLQYAPGAGFSSFAAARSGKTRAQGAALQVEAQEIDLRNALNAECSSFQGLESQRADILSSADLSHEIYTSYTNQYMAGKKGVLDLLNMVREREIADIAATDLKNSVLQSQWRLFVETDPSVLQALDRGQ